MADSPSNSEWQDDPRWFVWPYRDFEGRFVLLPNYTQRRLVVIDSVERWEYRERKETADEYYSRQF